MNLTLTEFEKELLDMLLAGEDAVLSLLRKQFSSATIRSKQQTGEGFYLSFDVPEEIPRVNDEVASVKPDFCFGDVDAAMSGIRNGASFLVWVKNGYLKQLEGYTYGERWPNEVTNYTLRYREGNRNIAVLRNNWFNK